ncbi:periplasmic binding protein-like I, partial [Polychytrium aggregatum]|uniref:periplasmic binding protein-like I n=1 Tax=Polychytrium aggregatum TaxID=110093 RepID=UPI0022FE06AC
MGVQLLCQRAIALLCAWALALAAEASLVGDPENHAAAFTGKPHQPAYPVHPTKAASAEVVKIGVFGLFSDKVVNTTVMGQPHGRDAAISEFGIAILTKDVQIRFYGVQAAADIINSDNSILPGIDGCEIDCREQLSLSAVPHGTFLHSSAFYQLIEIDCIDVYDSVSTEASSILTSIQAMGSKQYVGFIGDTTEQTSVSTAIREEGIVAGKFNYPFCTYMSGSLDIYDRSTFSTTFRVVADNSVAGASIADWVYTMGWCKVVVVISCSQYDTYGASLYAGFAYRSAFLGITILDTIPMYCENELLIKNNWTEPVARIQRTYGRILIVLGNVGPTTMLYLQASKHGLTGPEYVWYVSSSMGALSSYLSDIQAENEPTEFDGIPLDIISGPYFVLDGPVTLWMDHPFWNLLNETWSIYNLKPEQTIIEPWSSVPLVFDCALAIIYGIDNMLKQFPGSVSLDMMRKGQLPRALTSPSAFSTGYMGAVGLLDFTVCANEELLGSDRAKTLSHFVSIDDPTKTA